MKNMINGSSREEYFFLFSFFFFKRVLIQVELIDGFLMRMEEL